MDRRTNVRNIARAAGIGAALAVLTPAIASAGTGLSLRAPEEDDAAAGGAGAPAEPSTGAEGGDPAAGTGEGPDAGTPTDAPADGATPEGDPAASTGEDAGEPGADGAGEGAAEGPDAETPEGEDDGYASSKDAGQALSGEEAEDDGVPTDSETVGDLKKKPKNLSHHKTGMIGVAAGIGYGMLTGGDKYCGEFATDPTSQDRRNDVCFDLAPAFLDFMLGFGAAERIDVVVGFRLNLQKRSYDPQGRCGSTTPCTDGEGLFLNHRAIGVFPGVRIFGKKTDQVAKVGGAIDFVYMYENMQGYRDRPSLGAAGDVKMEGEPADADNDENEDDISDHALGLRGGPLIQIDPHHNVGIYIIPAAIAQFRPQKAGAENAGWVEFGLEASVGVQARFP